MELGPCGTGGAGPVGGQGGSAGSGGGGGQGGEEPEPEPTVPTAHSRGGCVIGGAPSAVVPVVLALVGALMIIRRRR